MSVVLITFLFYLFVLGLINYLVYRRKQRTPIEFSLAGRNLNWLTSGLSGISTQYSAWLLLGWVGMAYMMGLSVLWLTIGVIPCVAIGWFWMAKRLRIESEKLGAITVTEYLSRKTNDKNKILVLGSIIGIVFMLLYVTSQLVATGKVFDSMLGVDYTTGVILGAIIIGVYNLLGGYRGDCYTDIFQGFLMTFTLILLPIWAIFKIGGLGEFFTQLSAYPNLLSVTGGMSGLLLLGLILLVPFGQLTMFGMPHVMKRMMSMKNSKQYKKTALAFGIPALLLPVMGLFIGWSAKLMLLPLADAEQALPLLANAVFPQVLTGMVVAGIMAAIMSSADSQLLYAATEIGQNLFHRILNKDAKPATVVKVIRLSVVFLLLVALLLAFKYTGLVFSLIVFVAAGLTVAFGVPVLMTLLSKKINSAGVIAGMILGIATTIAWKQLAQPGFVTIVATAPIGFMVGMLTTYVVSLFTQRNE